MSYNTGEAAILTLMQSVTGFSSSNTSRGNWLILNKGLDDNYAILRPGGFSIEWITFQSYHANYSTVVEVWQRYIDDATTHTSLYTHVGNIITSLNQYYKLNGTSGVIDASIASADEPEEMWRKGGGPQWLRWRLVLEWKEEVNVTFAK